MSKPTLLRRLLKVVGILAALVGVVVLAGIVWLLLAGYADLRGDGLKQEGVAARAEKGRRLLEQAARRHGLDAWRGHTTVEVVARDVWKSQGQWPQPDQRFRAERLLGTFTSRVELLDGAAQGEVWGIQSWAPYKRRTPSGEPEMIEDPKIEFYLPTLQYFDELPFRLLNAEVVAYNGTGTYLGQTYDRVFVTWGSPEAHAEHDQYDVWIHPETHLIDVVRYTVRDAVALASPVMRPVMKVFAAGTIHYQDYREVDGVMVPFKQTVTLPPPETTVTPLDENYFHQLAVESVGFDTFDPVQLVADPDRPEIGDSKPS